MFSPCDGLEVRRGCPSCGAPLKHQASDRTVACEFCGCRVALLTEEAHGPYAVPGRASAEMVSVEAKRFLRGREERVRAIEAARLVYVPYFRLAGSVFSASRLLLERTRRRPDETSACDLDVECGDTEFQYRVGFWEQTVCALPRVKGLYPTLGIRTRTQPVVPVMDLAGGAQPHTAPPALVTPNLDEGGARLRLEVMLREAGRADDETMLEHHWTAIGLSMSQVYYPFCAVAWRGPERSGVVLLDGLTGKALDSLETFEPETRDFETLAASERIGAEPAMAAGGNGAPRVLSLICPACSAPLRLRPHACIYPCPICERSFRVSGGALCSVEEVVRLLVVDARGGRPRRAGAACRTEGGASLYLPFYFGPESDGKGGQRNVLVPAAEARHPRALWNVASTLSRLETHWETQPGKVPAEVAVVLEPEDARSLLPLAAASAFGSGATPQDPPHGPCSVEGSPAVPELAWVRFDLRGNDWVEPASGLAVPVQALIPWN